MEPPLTNTHPRHRSHPLANYQFSSDELRVLRECNSESFFQRSLPLGLGFGLSAYAGVKSGYFRPNARFGAAPKVIMGVIVGYFMGKFSYQQKCAEKLMLLPNSRLGELLRQRKQSGNWNLTPDASMGMALASPFVPSGGADVYSDEGVRPQNPNSALNLDLDRPTYAGLDDIYRPTLDSTTTLEPELPLEPAKPGTTYEELRQRNREEYMKKQQNLYSRPLPAEAPLISRAPESRKLDGQDENLPLGRAKTNKYGDSWTD